MRRYVQPGFTLLEMLLVISLLGIVVAFAWPDFSAATRAERLQESARRMEALVSMCRAEAMNESRRYRIMVRPDGSVRTMSQLDGIKAPHVYTKVHAGWAMTEVLLDDVWVAAVQELPEGPPPIRIVDEHLQFPETKVEPIAIEEFEQDVTIDFEPDGSSNSLRWVLRDIQGRALLITLDGRLGRMTVEGWEPIPPEEVQRPKSVEEDETEEPKLEDFE